MQFTGAEAFTACKHRALLVMATGTGKTRTAMRALEQTAETQVKKLAAILNMAGLCPGIPAKAGTTNAVAYNSAPFVVPPSGEWHVVKA